MSAPGLTLYVRVVVLTGAVVLAQALLGLGDAPRPIEWIVLGVLAVLAGSFTLRIASVEASVSVADTFLIAATLLYGPAPATVALAVDTFVLSWRKRHPWSRVAFNTAAPALSLWVAGQVFFFLSGVPPLALARSDVGALLLPLLALAAVYFVLNSGLMAIAVGLEAGQSPFEIWRRHFGWLSLSYFAAASVALGLTLTLQQVGPAALAIILPVVALFHWTFRASFGRLDDANRHLSQMDRLYLSTVETLAMAIDAKDDVTHSHVRRVQAYATALARALGVRDETMLKAIEAEALLHDTGKLAVPEHILNKPGRLTPAEFEQMKRHVDVGADILSLVDFPYPVVPIVRCHHENWDGTGYPRGVVGSEIPIGARILSVVDCFDALTSDRPYRRRMSDEEAWKIVLDRRGTMYDPLVVDTFKAIYRDIPAAAAPAEEHRLVMQQITPSRRPDPVASETAPALPEPAGGEALAFVSLARLASGAVGRADVIAMATHLMRGVVPGASGAWYLPSEGGDELHPVGAFGPAAAALTGQTIRVGEKLTGWVAAHRQLIVNSDAALDLGERVSMTSPPLAWCLAAPLVHEGAFGGVLTLYAGAHAFTDDQGRLLQMIAPHLAQAFQTAAGRVDGVPAGRDLRLVASR